MITESISAISTAIGVGGVAIIRISGADSLKIASAMFLPSGGVKEYEPNRMYAGRIICNGFEDYGFLVYFKAPKSFTGEDVAEFHCHGGVQIARGVLEKTFSLGSRLAERGEFTKRAFINGKLSLSSAEGMIDMINAESLAEVKASNMLYREKLTEKVVPIQNELKEILAAIAADSDYPEEDLEGLEKGKTEQKLKSVKEELSSLVQTYSVGKRIKSGVNVVLCGKPNVGKSSLLNALLGCDKAIVSSKAGTTRDVVEGGMEIGGIKFNLYDTAGIRERVGEIEKIGVNRAISAQKSADIVLLIRDGKSNYTPVETSGKVIKIFNKCDEVKPFGEYDLAISAKTGGNIPQLIKILGEYGSDGITADGEYITCERHFNALSRALDNLNSALENLKLFPQDVIFTDVTEAWSALGEITGETANEEIINEVFSKFCVGK